MTNPVTPEAIAAQLHASAAAAFAQIPFEAEPASYTAVLRKGAP